MLRDCHNPQDQEIIQTAYAEYLRVLGQEGDAASESSFASLSDSDSSQALSEAEQYCEGLFEDPSYLQRYLKAIKKKVNKYTEKLGEKFRDKIWSKMAENCDIRDIEDGLLEERIDKIPSILKVDPEMRALATIYQKREKFQNRDAVKTEHLTDYTVLLQDRTQLSKFQTQVSIS